MALLTSRLHNPFVSIQRPQFNAIYGESVSLLFSALKNSTVKISEKSKTPLNQLSINGGSSYRAQFNSPSGTNQSCCLEKESLKLSSFFFNNFAIFTPSNALGILFPRCTFFTCPAPIFIAKKSFMALLTSRLHNPFVSIQRPQFNAIYGESVSLLFSALKNSTVKISEKSKTPLNQLSINGGSSYRAQFNSLSGTNQSCCGSTKI